jgi:2-polyprenyl-6-methoxyphenol hydroxylase-like FAD-dependent oxidoreductase
MGRTHDDAELMRGDLSALLYEPTKDDVEYLFGDSITGMTEGADGVGVTFENAPPRTFDLVIGADGLHSAVRSLAFGDESRFVRSLDHGVAIFTVPNHLELDREELVYVEPGRTLNLYSAGGDAKALFLFDAPAEIDRRDIAAQQAFLRERFGGTGWQAPRLLDEMASASDFYFDAVSQVVMPEWTRGRVALVGDAGYCPSLASGQGTSLALVGAYVLAGELAAAQGDHAAAFAAYEREMREFVEKNQKLGRDGIKRMVATGRFSTWLSVQMMRLLPRLPWRNAVIEKIVGPIQEAATAIELKDYAATTLDA